MAQRPRAVTKPATETTPATRRRKRGRPADAQKHAKILAAARHVFLEHGYGPTSMDAIARQAGVSKITIYAHFASKATLFGAIVQALAGRLTGTIEKLALAGRPPEQALTQFGRAYLTLALAPGSLALHRLIVTEAAHHKGLGRLIYDSGPKSILATLTDYLASRPDLHFEAADMAAEQFLGMVLGQSQLGLLMAARPPDDVRATINERVDRAVQLFLTGCRRQPAAPAKPVRSKGT